MTTGKEAEQSTLLVDLSASTMQTFFLYLQKGTEMLITAGWKVCYSYA